ncbi:hypothetical protein EYR36_007024 [Pleurotus pulmonarius]|nr:hypothetical protein EYR36_007024 [Pleurotus pulmonarius]
MKFTIALAAAVLCASEILVLPAGYEARGYQKHPAPVQASTTLSTLSASVDAYAPPPPATSEAPLISSAATQPYPPASTNSSPPPLLHLGGLSFSILAGSYPSDLGLGDPHSELWVCGFARLDIYLAFPPISKL